FLKTVKFTKTTELIQIVFENCKFDEGIKLEKGRIDQVFIYSNSDAYIEKITIGKVKTKTIEIIGDEESNINRLAIVNSDSIGRIRIEKIKIYKATFFKSLPQETEIFKCSVNSIYFDNLRNNNVLKLLLCRALNVMVKLLILFSMKVI
nr:hypothetical protein [Chitinophagaceae bacterium]